MAQVQSFDVLYPIRVDTFGRCAVHLDSDAPAGGMDVWVQCASNDNIKPEDPAHPGQTQNWPVEIHVAEAMDHADFRIKGLIASTNQVYACLDGANSNCDIVHRVIHPVIVAGSDDMPLWIKSVGQPIPVDFAPNPPVNHLVAGIESFTMRVGVDQLNANGSQTTLYVDVSDRGLLTPPTNSDNPHGTWPYIVKFDQLRYNSFVVSTNKFPQFTLQIAKTVLLYAYSIPDPPNHVLSYPIMLLNVP